MSLSTWCFAAVVGSLPAQAAVLPGHGEVISLEHLIPANERGILCLARDSQGRILGGTTGRAAHLFRFDPARNEVRHLVRLEGGIGFAYGLVCLPDGSIIAGTQADPTGIAVGTDTEAVGHLYRISVPPSKSAQVEDLGVPVPGQGIYTLAWLPASEEIVGNTWPDGHFFTYSLKSRQFRDYGPIAGYRTFETPRHAEAINRDTGRNVRYPRQVSRAIAVDPASGAYTAGANGVVYHYDPATQTLAKLPVVLPAVAGREPWASLDAAVVVSAAGPNRGATTTLIGGTSDGYLFEMRVGAGRPPVLRVQGKALAQGTIQALTLAPPTWSDAAAADQTRMVVVGVGGNWEGMPRWFALRRDADGTTLEPGNVPSADGQPSTVGFGALLSDGQESVYAGERDRIGRLVRYRRPGAAGSKPARKPPPVSMPAPPRDDNPRKLECTVVFAPAGTTTDGSGYTAIKVGPDGKVYVGATRYGDYAWLLRFDPALKPTFMEKVVSLRELTGERLAGINTQGKIHSQLVVGADGRIWFGSKQAHEVFGTRPEYGEEPNGYPGGHLCYFDPKTGFSRSLGILKKQEGLMGGVIDDRRGKLYFRSEPKNHFLVYDLKTGEVQDRGHVGAAARYMVIDNQGAVYTLGRNATLCRYDPDTGYVEDLAIRLEGEGEYTPPYVLALGPNGRLYGAGTTSPWIMEFDLAAVKPGPFPEVTLRHVAAAAPAGYIVQDIHAGTFGLDGKFYYPLVTGKLGPKGTRLRQDELRIMRFDPLTKTTETVGVPVVVGLDESKVRNVYNRGEEYKLDYMQGAAVGPDGSLYLLDIYPQLNVACFPKLTAPR